MRILINGKDGFIAGNLYRCLSSAGHAIIATSHAELNPLHKDEIKRFFDNNEVDVVIHTISKGGRRIRDEQNNDSYETVLMFENMITYSKCKIFFNLGSGAEFDRSGNIINAKEEDVFNVVPTDKYGFAKNLISKRMAQISNCQTINLRLFNCFGANEAWHRLVRRAIIATIENQPITIRDKYMDFFFVEDLCRIVEWCLNFPLNAPQDMNCVYDTKHTILDIVKKIQVIGKTNNKIIIEPVKEFHYTGNGDLLKTLPINLLGLDQGLVLTYNIIVKQLKSKL